MALRGHQDQIRRCMPCRLHSFSTELVPEIRLRLHERFWAQLEGLTVPLSTASVPNSHAQPRACWTHRCSQPASGFVSTGERWRQRRLQKYVRHKNPHQNPPKSSNTVCYRSVVAMCRCDVSDRDPASCQTHADVLGGCGCCRGAAAVHTQGRHRSSNPTWGHPWRQPKVNSASLQRSAIPISPRSCG